MDKLSGMDVEFYDCEDPSRPTFSIAKDEVNTHYHFMGSTDRYWIQPAALLVDPDSPSRGLLTPVESLDEKKIAEEFARYFQKETGFDPTPYSSTSTRPEGEQVFLIRSPEIKNVSHDFMVGAVGIEKAPNGLFVVVWIWLHPFSRSAGNQPLALRVWSALESSFGELAVLEPTTKPMNRFLKKHRPDTRRVRMRY